MLLPQLYLSNILFDKELYIYIWIIDQEDTYWQTLSYLHFWKLKFPCRCKTDKEMQSTDSKIGFFCQSESFLSASEFSCRYSVDREIILRQVYNVISVVLDRQENLVYRQKMYFPVG
jgi:hypothetical protein